MPILFEASPTVLFFLVQALGVPQSIASLAIAVWAVCVIVIQGRRGWSRDAVFLGCNIHFMVAGPLLWALFLTGMSDLARPILDNVLVGVPLAVCGVLTWRAAKGQGSWILVGVALLAVLISLSDAQNYVRAISVPLGMILVARVILARRPVG